MTDGRTGLKSFSIEDCMSAIIDYRGKTPRKTSSGVPLITAKIVKGGRIEAPDEFIDPDEYESWMRRGCPKVGDVVLTTEAPLGEIAQLSDDRIALAQRLILLRGKPDVLDNTYLKYLMMSAPVQGELRGRASGTTVVGIKQSELRKLTLLLPAVHEQRAIAGVLGALDDKIEQNRRTSAALEQLARAMFRAWFVDFEPVKAKAAGAGAFPSMPQAVFDELPARLVDSELDRIPEGWRAGSILEEAELISGGTPSTSELAYWEGDIPWASAKDVSQCREPFVIRTERRITARGLEESSTKLIPAWSSVVVARGATTGRMSMFGDEIAMNQTCYALRSRNGADATLYCQLREVIDSFVHAAHGSVFDTITTGTFRSSRVLLPTTALLIALEGKVRPLFELTLSQIRESSKLAEFRDYLLPKLLSGAVRVRTAERAVSEAV